MFGGPHLSVFLKGLIIGVAIAAPVGPIGALCIRRTLHHGRWSGFVSGLGAALADGIYGAIAAFGVTFVSGFLLGHRFWFHLIGSIFLLVLAIRTLRSSTSLQATHSRLEDLAGDFISTFLLTIANPITILTFGVIFAEFGVKSFQYSSSSAGLMVLGVFLGSASWWAILCGVVGRIRDYISPKFLRNVNLVSGSIILAFAAFGLFRVVETLILWIV